jgi:hypothetical protein
MKKLGTPIGAGPGSANEKLGFDGVGTPLEVRCGGGDAGLVAFFFLFCLFFCLPDELFEPPEPTVPAGARCLDGRWDLPGDVGLGAVCVGVVDDGVVFDLPPEPPGVVVVCVLLVGLVGVLVVGVVVVGVVDVGGGGHTLEISVVPGGSGAPAGSWTCSTWPVAVLTVTVQSAAEAMGIAAKPITVPNEATAVTTILSLRVFNTIGFVLPPSPTRMSIGPRLAA